MQRRNANNGKTSGPPGLRIIAGQWRGRKLIAPTGETTRPSSDRLRETLFSSLTSRLGGFSGLAVADLFAGSGALGLEALSRGAASCIFVEQDRAALSALETNSRTVGASGCDIRAMSAFHLPPRSTPLDLILLDPPYVLEGVSGLLDDLVNKGWADPATLLSVEGARGTTYNFDKLEIVKAISVGKSQLSFLIPRY
jgi:16S rRNA (guanine966-N2)-methyltransferase